MINIDDLIIKIEDSSLERQGFFEPEVELIVDALILYKEIN